MFCVDLVFTCPKKNPNYSTNFDVQFINDEKTIISLTEKKLKNQFSFIKYQHLSYFSMNCISIWHNSRKRQRKKWDEKYFVFIESILRIVCISNSMSRAVLAIQGELTSIFIDTIKKIREEQKKNEHTSVSYDKWKGHFHEMMFTDKLWLFMSVKLLMSKRKTFIAGDWPQ